MRLLVTPLHVPTKAEKAARLGFFTKEGHFAFLTDTLCFWGHSNGTEVLDVTSGARTELDFATGKYPLAVVGSPDGLQVAICESGGWVKVVTLKADRSKKKGSVRQRLDDSLTFNGFGFAPEAGLVVVRGPGSHELAVHACLDRHVVDRGHVAERRQDHVDVALDGRADHHRQGDLLGVELEGRGTHEGGERRGMGGLAKQSRCPAAGGDGK